MGVRGRWIFKFEAKLIYIESPGPARATQLRPHLKIRQTKKCNVYLFIIVCIHDVYSVLACHGMHVDVRGQHYPLSGFWGLTGDHSHQSPSKSSFKLY